MEKNPIHEFIERLPFFQEFSDDEKAKLVNTFGIFEKYKEGESGSALFVVLAGSIRITKSTLASVQEGHISLQEPEEVTIAELKAGSIFGEISLISNRPRNSNALADSPQVVVMKITTEKYCLWNFPSVDDVCRELRTSGGTIPSRDNNFIERFTVAAQ